VQDEGVRWGSAVGECKKMKTKTKTSPLSESQEVVILDLHDGCYALEYNVSRVGWYVLTVLVNGARVGIPHSPLRVQVVCWSVVLLCCCVACVVCDVCDVRCHRPRAAFPSPPSHQPVCVCVCHTFHTCASTQTHTHTHMKLSSWSACMHVYVCMCSTRLHSCVCAHRRAAAGG
jgi:hypothetical protein